ncbi:Calx-beta domain-containing protein [Paenibacillus tarimensis]|uniref:Calx-beta domain-containing protein n=1 Tax=Paenibacillus tarimensis TaxID=416012 RepID=UPI001F271116|nr:Calx-beta domain-containing protein [Paenibacillus tarimensis]MCF2942032.1 hypothetical protein [Paenibacillus tarimensis]
MRKAAAIILTAVFMFVLMFPARSEAAAPSYSYFKNPHFYDYDSEPLHNKTLNYYGAYENQGYIRLQLQDHTASRTYKVMPYNSPGFAVCDETREVSVESAEGLITPNNEERYIDLPIKDDYRSECTEILGIWIGWPGKEIDTYREPDALLYVFDDDRPVVTFTSTSNKHNPIYSVVEDGRDYKSPSAKTTWRQGLAVIGDLRQPVSAELKVCPECAERGADFIAVEQMSYEPDVYYVFDPAASYEYYANPFQGHEGAYFKSIESLVKPIDDSEVEMKAERVKLKIHSLSSNAKLGPHKNATVQIIDNDRPSFYFSKQKVYLDSYSFTAEIAVARNKADDEAKVFLATVEKPERFKGTDRDATPGEDYEPLGQWVTFAPGETVKKVTLNIIDDNWDTWEEYNEYIFLELQQPSRGYQIMNEMEVVLEGLLDAG